MFFSHRRFAVCAPQNTLSAQEAAVTEEDGIGPVERALCRPFHFGKRRKFPFLSNDWAETVIVMGYDRTLQPSMRFPALTKTRQTLR